MSSDNILILYSSNPQRRALTGCLDEVEVELYAAALNFKETLIVLGMLPRGTAPSRMCGWDARAVDGSSERARRDHTRSWRRCDRLRNGRLASHIVASENEVLRFDPRRMSFEQAACLPTVFMTAHLGLNTFGKLQHGERVLIHAAAGGVGLAAVQIARAAGAEIYATASREKWRFLRQQGITHIFDSRSPALPTMFCGPLRAVECIWC